MGHLTLLREITESKANEIRKFLVSNYERELFDAVIENLVDLKNTLRLSNFAYAAREFIRIYLDNRSDDEAIKSCSWYDANRSAGKITRKDRMHYVIHKSLSPQYVYETLHIDIESAVKSLRNDIDDLSKYTHISNTFKKNTNNEIAISIFNSLWSFIDTIEKTKNSLCEHFESELSELANDAYLFEFFDDIDILSTHSTITDAYVQSIDLIEFDENKLLFKVNGKVYVELQWGSDSDFRRGDGARGKTSFPFSMEIQAATDDLSAFEVISHNVHVDDESPYSSINWVPDPDDDD